MSGERWQKVEGRGQKVEGRWQRAEGRRWEVEKVGIGKKSEVGPVAVPNERDYAAAKDAEVGNWKVEVGMRKLDRKKVRS